MSSSSLSSENSVQLSDTSTKITSSTIPRAMAKAILPALEKDPAERFDSAGEFADAFSGK